MSYYVLKQQPTVIDSLYEEYYLNGQLRSQGSYSANKPVGVWKYYHENGNLRMVGEIKNFKNEGFWTYYHENGLKFTEGTLVNGVKEGEWNTYYDNGKLKSRGAYIKGKPEGPWFYFYEDGGSKAMTFFNKGRGAYKEYYKSGILKMEGVLSEGKSDSIWNYYHENGRLKASGLEVNGLKDGFWKFFHDNGLVASEGLYLNGVPFGNWKYYHDNGTLSAEGAHKNGEKDGFWKLYYPTGEFKAETQFSMGQGPYKEYYESGKLKVSGYIKKGLNEGAWVYYYEDGSLEGKCQFVNGEGDFVGYYPNGVQKMEGRIQDGVKTGVWKLYKPQGELAGFYRTFYENKETVFVPLEESKDTLKKEVKDDTLLTNKKQNTETKVNPPRRRRYSKIRYFRPKLNEYKAMIVGANPVAMPIYYHLPLYVEYMIEDRLGFQFVYAYYKFPFFRNAKEDEFSNLGHSFELMQKFYQPTTNLGSLYFGHSVRWKTLTWRNKMQDSTSSGTKTYNCKLVQPIFEYAIVGGNRIFMSGRSDKSGWTLDFYVGLRIGFMHNEYDSDNSRFAVEEAFKEAPLTPFYVQGKLGVSFSYMF